MNTIPLRISYSPSAYLARGIENALITIKEMENIPVFVFSCIAIKAIALITVPLVFTAELLLIESCFAAKSFVKCTLGYKEAPCEWECSMERASKLALGILFSPLAILAADGVSYLFLERAPTNTSILPFGVENVYGKDLKENSIRYPNTREELQEIVRDARANNKKISIIGAGMSQGQQTIPEGENYVVLNLRNLRKVDPATLNTIKVEAGAIWEEVQFEANKSGKSVIVKQASDLFSVGGSIGINCHGWEHEYGAIASTVESLEIIDANGEIKILSREDNFEHFQCMFGTMGYFGIIVSATLRLKDNELLQEKGVPVKIEDFKRYYEDKIAGSCRDTVPLLIGRLNVDKHPLTELYVNTFEQILPKPSPEKAPLITENFELEPIRGRRFERMFLDAVGHLPKFLYDPLMRFFWNREITTMEQANIASRNEILHFGVKSFFQLHQSDLYTQWLQEYFIDEDKLPEFLAFLSATLEENDVRLLNASIRPTPKDDVSILPYADKSRYAIVISFHQLKTKQSLEKTKTWIDRVQKELLAKEYGKWYQAYMPISSKEEFQECYGKETIEKMQRLKAQFDPRNIFSNKHTTRYYDQPINL